MRCRDEILPTEDKSMIQTVTGPIEASQLGKTFCHEHLVFGYVGWQGDLSRSGPFDENDAVKTLLEALLPQKEQFGLGTIVDATPNDCGRDPALLRRFSEESGLRVICSTGYYNELAGGSSYFKMRSMFHDPIAELIELMELELTEGICGTGIKAGVIKAASGHGAISDYEKWVFTAAAKASRDTGTPIITHTEEGTCAVEQARLLISEGADARKIQIGHVGVTTDLDYYKRILDCGVFIAFDRIGIEHMMGMLPDAERAKVIAALVRDGYGDRILISQDMIGYKKGKPTVIAGPNAALIPNRGWHNIFSVFVPRLREEGLSEREIDALLIDNPARLYGA